MDVGVSALSSQTVNDYACTRQIHFGRKANEIAKFGLKTKSQNSA